MAHLMLFDLYAGGHHGQYVRQLAAHWGAKAPPGRLDVVVSSAFGAAHPDVARLAERYAASGVRLVPIDETVRLRAAGPLRLARNALEHGRLLRRYVAALRPDHVLLMYFDHVQLSLAANLRFDFPVRLSGIYFRPSFHYAHLNGVAPGTKEKLRSLRSTVQLRAALRNPPFDTLFCLDPFAVPYVQDLPTRVQAVALPDGIEQAAPSVAPSQVRKALGVEPGRAMLLLFGALDRRKGLFALLDAFSRLSDDACRRACLVLAGCVVDADRAALRAAINALQKAKPAQLILRDAFVPEDDIQDLMRAADLVLLPYQRHIGSSGVLVRAAAAQTPVLGADYGLVGALIRTRRLGLAVETTDPRALAHGLETCLAQPAHTLFDAAEAARFAGENTAELFSETIFRRLLPAVHERG